MSLREVSGSQPSFLESMPSGAKTCGKIMAAIAVITALGACAAFCGQGNLAAAGTLVMFGGVGAFGVAGAIFTKIMCGTVENDEDVSEQSQLPAKNDEPKEKSNKHHEREETTIEADLLLLSDEKFQPIHQVVRQQQNNEFLSTHSEYLDKNALNDSKTGKA